MINYAFESKMVDFKNPLPDELLLFCFVYKNNSPATKFV